MDFPEVFVYSMKRVATNAIFSKKEYYDPDGWYSQWTYLSPVPATIRNYMLLAVEIIQRTSALLFLTVNHLPKAQVNNQICSGRIAGASQVQNKSLEIVYHFSFNVVPSLAGVERVS